MVTKKVPMTLKTVSNLLSLSSSDDRVLAKLIPKLVTLEILNYNADCYSFPRFEARQDIYPSDLTPNKLRINSEYAPNTLDPPYIPPLNNSPLISPQYVRCKKKEGPPLAPQQKAKESFEDYTKALRDSSPEIKDFDAELEKFQLWWEGRILKRPKLALRNWIDKAKTKQQEDLNGKGKQNRDSGRGAGPRREATAQEIADSIGAPLV